MYYDPATLNFPRAKENFITVYNHSSATLRACEPAFIQGLPENFAAHRPCLLIAERMRAFFCFREKLRRGNPVFS
jgi:hypothetical protein